MATYTLDPQTGLPTKKKTQLDLSGFGLGGDFGGGTGLNLGGFGDFAGSVGVGSDIGTAGAPKAAAAGPLGAPNLGFTSLQGLLDNPEAFQNLILNDPTYKQAVGDLGGQGVTDAASRDAAIRRGLVQFGGIPDFGSGQLAGLPFLDTVRQLVDPATQQAADKFTGLGWSTLGQLNTANERRRADLAQSFDNQSLAIKNNLAARGLTNSGESIYQNDQLQKQLDTNRSRGEQDYNQAKFTATQNLVDYLAGTQAAYAEAQRQRDEQKRLAAEDAANRIAAFLGQVLPATPGDALTPPPAPSAPPPPPPAATSPSTTPQALADYASYLGGTPVGGPTLYRPAPPKPKLNLRYSGSRIG